MFVDSWLGLGRTRLVRTLADAAPLLRRRVAGKSTLSTMHAADLVASVALGSTLVTILHSPGRAFGEGVAAFALLVGLQFAITWRSVRSPVGGGLVKSEPPPLVDHGQSPVDPKRQARVVEGEGGAVVRQQGLASLAAAEAVVLGADGGFPVVEAGAGPATVLAGVAPLERAWPHPRGRWERPSVTPAPCARLVSGAAAPRAAAPDAGRMGAPIPQPAAGEDG